MAVGNSDPVKYYTISGGKVVMQVKNPTATSTPRVNKKKFTVHEELYGFIDGFIANIEAKMSKNPEYGKQWNILLVDGDDRQLINLPYSSSVSSAFLKILPNVDLNKKVKIVPTHNVVNGKDRYGLFIIQDGNAVPWYYTKEQKHGLPDMQQVRVKGELVWDDSDMMEFLENYVKEKVQPALAEIYKGGKKPAVPEDDELADQSAMSAAEAMEKGKVAF